MPFIRSTTILILALGFCLSASLLPAQTFGLTSAGKVLPKPRNFSPGVLTTIPPELEPEATVSVQPMVEIRADKALNWKPELKSESRTLYNTAARARFRRDVWGLEFAFKPLRMIYVNVRNANGTTERKLIWYLVYRVRNTGESLVPTKQEGGLYDAKPGKGGPQRFVPHFVLEGHELDAAGKPLYRAYLDRVIPAALEPIRQREVPGRVLLSNVAMAQQPIPVADERDEQGVWGVAMWEGVDPEMDFFSVYVRGLTNAYRWADQPEMIKPGDPPGKGRTFVRKTLQLCFWRPGDEFLEHESEVRFGAPIGKEDLYGVEEGVAHRWIYR